jgi:hypothetical protein
MILNYFKVAIRNLSRQKDFSFINIFGLEILPILEVEF